jgi:uncharacterized protein (TIGR03905 family)
MKYTYFPSGVCSTEITFDIEGDIIKNIDFTDGCHGNLQALSRLLEGMPVSFVKEKLSGIRCGYKSTSCADQLVKGIDEALRSMPSSR